MNWQIKIGCKKKNQNLLSNTKLIPNIQNRHLRTIFGQNKITKIPLGSNLPYMANWGFSKLGFINIPKYLNKNQRIISVISFKKITHFHNKDSLR